MPKFTKGHNMAKGRPKGTINKDTEFIRNALKKVMMDNLPGLQQDLDNMRPNDKWNILEKLAKYYIPAL